jgi:hypothetical protein
MRAPVLVVLLLLSSFCGCIKNVEQDVTPVEARSIANRRYVAHTKALGVNSSRVPSPSVEYRGQDTVFVYTEPTTTKKVVVIVDKSGDVADTVEPL